MVRYVVDETMPHECIVAAEETLLFYQEERVDYLELEYEDHSWIGFHGLPPHGTIAIHYVEDLGFSKELNTSIAGLASWERFDIIYHDCYEDRCEVYSPIASVDVEISYCKLVIVAHEIGHALGLDHNKGSKNLMYPIGYESHPLLLNEAQLGWIRR